MASVKFNIDEMQRITPSEAQAVLDDPEPGLSPEDRAWFLSVAISRKGAILKSGRTGKE